MTSDLSKRLDTQPEECLLIILRHLPACYLVSICRTNRYFRDLGYDEGLWKHRCIVDYGLQSISQREITSWRALYARLKSPKVFEWDSNTYPIDYGRFAGKKLVKVVCTGWGRLASTATGEIWFWGKMNGETWGDNRSRNYQEPVQVANSGSPLPRVLDVTGGRTFGIALTNDPAGLDRKRVFVFSSVESVWEIEGLRDKDIVKVAAGWAHGLALSRSGTIYIFPTESATNQQYRTISSPSMDNPYVEMGGGEDFCVALTCYGDVYKWSPNAEEALIVPGLSGLGFTKLSSFFRHYAVFGQDVRLSNLHPEQSSTKQVIPIWCKDKSNVFGLTLPDGANSHDAIRQIAFGDWHSLCLTKNGKVYKWGEGCTASKNAFPQSGPALGNPESSCELLPFSNTDWFVIQIAAGGHQAACLAVQVY
ncbi:hypothetical protein SpCBS45565_g02808 [Spizellomyces sp. 'palustris']|nr:hypothetical protein SpCBS45565_g02808 [Spizellomyces sp. 'palustris']